MKIILSIFLIGISILSWGQIDYQSKQLITISTSKPNVKIRWIDSSPCKCPLYFDHITTFINTKNDIMTGSDVVVKIYHNNEIVRKFNFKTGDIISNNIELPRPLNLKRKDSVYFKITLIPNKPDEEYVFNIFPRSLKTTPTSNSIVVNRTSESKPKQSNKKEVMTTSQELKRLRRNRTIVGIANLILR